MYAATRLEARSEKLRVRRLRKCRLGDRKIADLQLDNPGCVSVDERTNHKNAPAKSITKAAAAHAARTTPADPNFRAALTAET